MAKQAEKITMNSWLQSGLIRLCRVHFVLVALYIVYTIAADITKLTTPHLVLLRWTMTVVLLIGVSILWYLARGNVKNTTYYRLLIYILIMLDVAMATFNIYTQRGMASRAVALFAIPIVVSSILLNRTAIYMTATISAATYSLAAVKYFVDFFNEGYKAELYIEIGLYCGGFFILAAILSILIKFKNSEADNGL